MGWESAAVRMNQLQRAQHMQDHNMVHQPSQLQEPAKLPWLKIMTPQRAVAKPGMQAAGFSPQEVAGGAVMLDVNAGVGAEAGAPAFEDAAVGAPMQPKTMAFARELQPSLELHLHGSSPGGARSDGCDPGAAA